MLRPTSGTVNVDEVAAEGANFVSLFDDPNHLPLTPIENVWPAGFDSAERSWLLESLPLSEGVREALSDDGQSEPAELSGGKWQQLGICRTLLEAKRSHRPLALDEPTSNLAFELQLPLMESLIAICRQMKLGCCFVTHHPDLAKLADRRIHVADGRIQVSIPETT